MLIVRNHTKENILKAVHQLQIEIEKGTVFKKPRIAF